MSQTSAIKYIIVTLICALTAIITEKAHAFPTDTYTSSSVLASGKWQKISVSSSGIHFIPASTLRSWGFSSHSRVKIHGYGGQQLPDRLTIDNYIDDLPQVQTVITADGVYFYAVGTVTWERDNTGRYTHTLNPYSSAGYYYITENDNPQMDIPTIGRPDGGSNPADVFTEKLYHEVDAVTLSQSGTSLWGEDFRYTRTHTFDFNFPDMANSSVWSRTTFVANQKSSGTLTFTANGSPLPTRTVIGSSSSQSSGTRSTTIQNIPVENGNRLTLGITYTPSGSLHAAHLDAIDINYSRKIALYQGKLEFSSETSAVALSNASAGTHVWDITDPTSIKELNASFSNGRKLWTNDYTGLRNYVAWNEGASYPVPKLTGSVSNQNLHGISTTPDMVIITVKDWAGEAQRLANLHRNSEEALTVEVIVQDDIFHEFSSGTRDIGAFRRFLKMIYDRGIAAGHPLRYAMVFGRPSFDNRNLTAEMRNISSPYTPSWQSTESLSVSSSYTSDDIMAMLSDHAPAKPGDTEISIAVGRVSARSLTQAKTFVDKMYDYYDRSKMKTEGKNRVVLMADNGEHGQFMKDSEAQYTSFMSTESGRNMFYNKVYIDAFTIDGGVCTGGRKRLHQLLEEGVMWLNYIGHGATATLADENLVSRYDMEHLYNKQFPILYAATCTFARWDGTEQSGSEIMLFNPKGGIIAGIAPTRESRISFNGVISKHMGDAAFSRNGDGRLKTIGDIYLDMKRRCNKLASESSANSNDGTYKLMYVLLGDPAMRLTTPDNTVRLDMINGETVIRESQITVQARQQVELTGTVCDPHGNPISDFNGEISLSLYDAEYSTTSNGLPLSDGEKVTFDEQDSKLFTGRSKVTDGVFTLRFTMPTEVADNFRPAALNMYAYSPDGREAIGCNRDFYVYGLDENAQPDDTPPTIEYAYLNHESFSNGSTVNTSPMFIAKVSDDIGINMSMTGIGHQMSIKLDDSQTYSDVSLYYTPSADSSISGTIAYPMDNVPEGYHTLTFRVWDTSGNSTYHSLNFFAQAGLAPKLFDIYTDANPASTEANFYISHNQPDAELTVTLEIYNMLGRLVWSTTVTDRSDMFLSAPITWNLCGLSGSRVGRGIYIYRAIVKTDGSEAVSSAKRIAVTGH